MSHHDTLRVFLRDMNGVEPVAKTRVAKTVLVLADVHRILKVNQVYARRFRELLLCAVS